ncbi:hypothetical protein BGW38_008240 [Lunasporangiospora selenospora]|uniref:Uncharacterized protein n=1 Tax=Lunasporangiospora selenospora TaxID=979761 RepID=A0A9P6K9X6_9FUNG|nr:hypothetical protein BGW38_008240 [Lunasporangiospora selenospora]
MPQEKPPGMEHMYNLVMYDRVLTTIRDTFGKLVRPTIPNGSTTTKSGRAAKRGPLYGPNDEEIIPQTLAFYRKRTVVKEYLKGLEEQQEALETALMTRNSLKGVIMESSSNAHHSERRGILDTSGVSMAKIRTKPNKSRPAGGSSKENNTLTGSSTLHTSLTLLDLSTSTNETFHSGHGDQKEFYSPLLQSTEPTHQPFVETTTGIPKKRKSPSSTLTLFSKTNQKKRLISVPTTRESLWHRGPSKNSDGRPKNPFVKSNNDEEERESLKSVEGLALDQETIAESRTKTATTHHSPAFTPIRGGSSSSGSSAACQPKPPTSSANLMMQWVQRKGKDPANNASGTSISSSTSTSISTPISSASDATPNQGGDSIIREFYFTEAPKKSVILDRWVHFSSSSSSSTLPRSREENEPRPFRNVIRVDRTSKLFSNHSDNDEQDPE